MPREQRLVFGEVATTYHRVRPGYPTELIDAVIAVAPHPAPVVIEIGAGTGKATALLAPRCSMLVAIEPSAPMAAIARTECIAYPQVDITLTTFEDWSIPPDLDHGVDVVVAAQAWHWVDHSIGYPKVAALLVPGGSLALFWNRPLTDRMVLHPEIALSYQKIAPELPGKRPWEVTLDAGMAKLRESGYFSNVSLTTFDRAIEYTTADYCSLLTTFSDHRLLEPDRLHQLLAAIAATIDKAGGHVVVPYTAELVVATRG